MKTPAERLKEARLSKGYGSAAAAVEALGWKYPAYSSHENGNRSLTERAARRYAKAFRVNWLWLMYGIGEKTDNVQIPLFGNVGAGAEVIPLVDCETSLEYVEAPTDMPEGTSAVRVLGQSMYPAYKEGNLIFFIQDHFPPDVFLNEECVVKLVDGRVFLKTVTSSGTPELYNLISHNAAPILNIRLEWASPVTWVRKR